MQSTRYAAEIPQARSELQRSAHLAACSSFGNALHLIFPFAAGFAQVGPFFAVGLYELSRRREAGLHTSWRDAFAVFRSPALPSIVALGFYLLVLFGVWIGVAQLLYMRLFGPVPPTAEIPFIQDLLTSPRGWLLIFSGGLIGLRLRPSPFASVSSPFR